MSSPHTFPLLYSLRALVDSFSGRAPSRKRCCGTNPPSSSPFSCSEAPRFLPACAPAAPCLCAFGLGGALAGGAAWGGRGRGARGCG